MEKRDDPTNHSVRQIAKSKEVGCHDVNKHHFSIVVSLVASEEMGYSLANVISHHPRKI
jgi:hypothetical protein